MDIVKIMADLSKSRPVYHFETDFQFTMAWHIQQKYKNAKVRLEYSYKDNHKKHLYLDIYISLEGINYGIELKYKTKYAQICCEHETFELSEHGAVGNALYDYWKDVQRLEYLIQKKVIHHGYAIFLTNDSAYWKEPKRAANYDSFRIQNKREIKEGKLYWPGNRTPKGATEKRNSPIKVSNNYTISWKEYSKKQSFMYTSLEISPKH